MPRRKITLDEAYAVFEQHGLKVRVEAVQPELPIVPVDHLFEQPAPPPVKPRKIGNQLVRINLRTRQTITSGGHPILDAKGKTIAVEGQAFHEYGPGPCVVPSELAGDLLYQDALAVEADRKFLSPEFRSYVILPVGGRNVGRYISNDPAFDLSGFLGQVGQSGQTYHLG